MTRKAHPIFQIPSRLTPADVVGEFEAAAHYGYTPDATFAVDPVRNWYEVPRLTRANLVAAGIVRRVTEAIQQHDTGEWLKRKNGGAR